MDPKTYAGYVGCNNPGDEEVHNVVYTLVDGAGELGSRHGGALAVKVGKDADETGKDDDHQGDGQAGRDGRDGRHGQDDLVPFGAIGDDPLRMVS